MIRRFLTKTKMILDMVKFEHTIFAMPFALISLILASRYLPHGLPGGSTIGWVVLAMVGARSAAMAFNRLADVEIDRGNPRTAARHLPAGLLTRAQVWTFFAAAAALLVFAASRLNHLCLVLSPVALAIVIFYSFTKRFTSLCHLFLGLATGIAPIGAWIAVRGRIEPVPLMLGAVVMLWIGGFDIIYALQDYDFDMRSRLYSLPVRLGRARALLVSRLMHTVMLALLVGVGIVDSLHAVYFVGVVVVAALITYEQRLVKPDDIRRVNLAFFTLNGWVSISLFSFVLLDRLIGR